MNVDTAADGMPLTLITGSNRGIGLELVRQCLARGDSVFACCRHASEALTALAPTRVITGVDVTMPEAAATLAAALQGETVDLLINNAGSFDGGTDARGFADMFATSSFDADAEALIGRMRDAFELNTVGPLRVTKAVVPFMCEGGKVVIISSMMGSISDNTSGGIYPYRCSKAAVNMAGVSMAVDLKKKGIAVGIIHPGMVKTGFTPKDTPPQVLAGQHPVEESVKGVLEAIDATTLETTGQFLHGNYGQGVKPCPW